MLTQPDAKPAEVRSGSRRPGRWRLPVALGVWCVLIAATALWALGIPAEHLRLGDVAPLYAHVRARPLTVTLIPAMALGGLIAWVGPRLAATMRWRPLLGLSSAVAAGWAIALAASDGFDRIGSTLTTRFEYLSGVAAVGDSPVGYLQHFVANLHSYPIHVKGHAPLAPLAFWALARAGLPQPTAAGLMVIAAGASAVAAVAVTVRITVGEDVARRALPFLVTLPAAVWIATSGDALFLGLSAWSVALLALGRRPGPTGYALPFGGGLLMGAAIFCSYGLLVLAPLPVAVAVLVHRLRALGVALAGVAVVVTLFAAAGFWYPDGFAATHREWAAGVGPHRSRPYFLFSNLADLAVIVGPATAVGLAWLRDRRLALIVAAVALAVLASDASGFVRGEAERIWLPFAPWIAVATGTLPLSGRVTRVLIGAQLALALVLQAVLRTSW